MKKFNVTFTNLNKECTLDHSITKALHSDSKEEAAVYCEDLYDDGNGNFRIINIVETI